ncbi:MAG: hypothetical protein R3274_05310 [Desulfobacterales bacterium]|nr:hypothetical protein [Desulfobacterales bacterium]
MTTIPIKVICYAGYRAEETPRTIAFKSHRIRVKQVLDCWLDPDHRYFKLLGDDDGVYIVRHDTHGGNWELTFYQASAK